MRLFHHFSSIPPDAQGAVVALGNFDGVHLGHQAVLAETCRIAERLGAPPAVFTFTPHPREFFKPDAGPLSIYPLHDKMTLLKEAGMEFLYLARFDTAFSQISAEDFVDKVLAQDLRVRHVITGDNFIFGHGRHGDAALLTRRAADAGFKTTHVTGLCDAGGTPVSSSRIREALGTGDVKAASYLLGRPYAISGHVRHGEGRGKSLGFPTANLAVTHIFRPAAGVYAVRVKLPDGRSVKGVANLGIRPTVGGTDPLLEAHCFDFSADLYEKIIEVQLVNFIRAERKFDSLDALKTQIGLDSAKAKEILASGA